MTPTSEGQSSIHATAIVIGEAGLLIRGKSGMGKSSFADLLIAEASRLGRFARLVGDDRVLLSRHHDRVVARGHPATRGLLERRGIGLVRCPFEAACVLRWVVDLVDPADVIRMPMPDQAATDILGLSLPVFVLPGRTNGRNVHLVLAQIGAI